MLEIDIHKNIRTEDGLGKLHVKANFTLGEITGLFGNSGQGKTSFFNMLAGLLKPDLGSIRMNQTIWFDAESKLNVSVQNRNIAYIFQKNNLFPNFTIEENISYAVNKKRLNEVNPTELLEQVGLGQLAKNYPHQLSGGQQQRAAIARALAQEANILLMDEPFTGLDIDIKLKLMKQIKELNKNLGLTILIISHHAHDLIQLCDEVFIMEQHNITQQLNVSDFSNYIADKMKI